MSIMRSLGRLGGKMSSNKELLAGVMEGMDPRAVAEAITENGDFMNKVINNLDPKAMADMMNDGLWFVGDMMKYMDPEKVAQVINENQRILPRYIECIDPDVFTRSAGSMVSKLRYATYRPPMFQKPGEASSEK